MKPLFLTKWRCIQLEWIYRYMNTHKKIYYATADTDQNKPIKYNCNNGKDFSMSMMFPNCIVLHENKRLKTIEDTKTIKTRYF